jgi:hypothetical protein
MVAMISAEVIRQSTVLRLTPPAGRRPSKPKYDTGFKISTCLCTTGWLESGWERRRRSTASVMSRGGKLVSWLLTLWSWSTDRFGNQPYPVRPPFSRPARQGPRRFLFPLHYFICGSPNEKGYNFEFPLLLYLDGNESEQRTRILHAPLSSADSRTTLEGGES